MTKKNDYGPEQSPKRGTEYKGPNSASIVYHPDAAGDACYAASLKGLSVAACRVMVVYDHDLESQMVARILARFGYGVTEAAGGPEAIIHVARAHFHLVITELEMPELNGFQLARRIKAQSPRTKIIIMAEGDHPQAGNPKNKAIDAWLFKPFKLVDLGNAICALDIPNAFQAYARSER